jgi:adenylate kinase
LKRSLAVNLVVDEEAVVRRIVSRRTCKSCGAIYGTSTNMPRVDGKCDACGGEVILRPDDREDVVRQRLATYHEQTRPVTDFYERRGQLLELDGSKEIVAVQRDLLELLDRLQ